MESTLKERRWNDQEETEWQTRGDEMTNQRRQKDEREETQ